MVRVDDQGGVAAWRSAGQGPGFVNHLLRLRADLRLPGLAWLELIIDSDDRGRTLFRQRALVHPRGLGGHVYWKMVYPFHGLVFGGMQHHVARAAEGLELASETSPRVPTPQLIDPPRPGWGTAE